MATICLRGRTGDHINVAGRKVSPAIIEQALREHEAVDECLVFGVPSGNADRIDHIVACVTADRHGTKDELKQFLLQKLPSWQVPREWWFVESLGINGHGKKSRARNGGRIFSKTARNRASRLKSDSNSAAKPLNRGGLCRWRSC